MYISHQPSVGALAGEYTCKEAVWSSVSISMLELSCEVADPVFFINV